MWRSSRRRSRVEQGAVTMIVETARKAILHFPSRASEWATSIILLNWALLSYYSIGNGFAPDGIFMWAVAFGILSVVRLIVLYVNGNLRLSPHYRSGLSFLSCFAWFQITLGAVSGPVIYPTDLAAFPVLLALDFYNAYHVAIEARITDESYKNARNA